MQPPIEVYLQCPHCGAYLLGSMSTWLDMSNSTTWSDGYTHFPYIPDSHPIARCSVCSNLFHSDEVSYLEEQADSQQVVASYPRGFSKSPTTTDYLAAIADGLHGSPEEEIKFCKAVWHQANDRIREHIKNVTDNRFWLRADDELRRYLIAAEEFFARYDAAVESNKYTDGNGFAEEALLQDLLRGLTEEAPELLDKDGERQLADEFGNGLTEEERSVFVSFASTTHLNFPEVPDEIRSLYEIGLPRSEVWAEITRRRASLNVSLEAIKNFRFGPEELSCLAHLSRLLESGNRFLFLWNCYERQANLIWH